MANIGVYTLIAAKRVKKVYAFEPSPNVFERLPRNVTINEYKNVAIFNMAIADKVGRVLFDESRRGDNIGLGRIASMDGKSNVLRVQTKRIDDLLWRSDSGDVGLIKIDIELVDRVSWRRHKRIRRHCRWFKERTGGNRV